MRGSSAGAMGISDMPMQLLIGAVILSLSAPLFASAYEDLSENIADQEAGRAVSSLIDTMETVLSGDEGSRLRITIELSGFGSCSFERMFIGGPLDEGSDMYILGYELGTGLSRSYSLKPPYPVTSADGRTLILTAGTHTISVERSRIGDVDCLMVGLQ